MANKPIAISTLGRETILLNPIYQGMTVLVKELVVIIARFLYTGIPLKKVNLNTMSRFVYEGGQHGLRRILREAQLHGSAVPTLAKNARVGHPLSR